MKKWFGSSGLKSQSKPKPAAPYDAVAETKPRKGIFQPLLNLIGAILSLPRIAFNTVLAAIPILLGICILFATVFIVVGEEAVQKTYDRFTPSEVQTTPIKPPVIYEQGIEPTSEDNRIPMSELSRVWNLNDPQLAQKLSGVGRIVFNFKRCTASLVGRRDFLVTASHCIVEKSADKPTKGNFRWYSPVCGRWYSGTRVHVRTSKFKTNHDLDWAFLKLDTPACDAAEPFQAMTLTDEAAETLKQRNHPLLALSVQPFADARRYQEFPQAWERAKLRDDHYTIFGVFCRFSKQDRNVTSHDGTLAYLTEGCGERDGASGGALVTSLDGGKTYKVIATLYGHFTKSRKGIYPRIKGEFASQLERFFAEWQTSQGIGGAS